MNQKICLEDQLFKMFQQNLAERWTDSLNEFAVDGFGDRGNDRSKLLASVGRLFDAGNKVDWQVPGQMGHVTRVQDDGITMKKWKTPHSRMSFFLPMRDDSRDSKYTIKMVGPKHYAVVSAEQGVAEGSEEYCDACDRVITKKPHVCPGSQGVAEGADQVKKVFKDKFGKPVGEIGIDPESSPGNGEWYVYHYATGYSVVGFDSAAEAKRELMYVHKHPEAVEGHPSTKEQGVAEDWNKINHHDKTNGLSQKAVNAYRHEHPGSKLKTAVTTKPSKLKAGSKDAKRRKSFCARMSGNEGPMKKPNGKPTPKALALRRWNCESVEELNYKILMAEQELDQLFEKSTTEKQARTMAAAAHDPKFAKKLGIKQSIAKEFNKADTGTKQLSNAMKHKKNKGQMETQTMNPSYPFAGKAVGQKTGKAGQLRGTDAGKLGGKQPAQGKLVGGA